MRQEIRCELTKLSEELKEKFKVNLPIIVLVDELDRCRPNYAIEMLESIKHLFKTNNFVFVVATNNEQLCHSIQAIYGSGFDSNQYLKRFFDVKASLPTPDLESYINNLNLDFSKYKHENLVLLPYNRINFEIYISQLSKHYELKIRDIDQLIKKLQSILKSAISASINTKKIQAINILTLFIALIEFDFNHKEFEERCDNTPCNSEFIGEEPYFAESKLSLALSVLYDATDSYFPEIKFKKYMNEKQFLSINKNIENNEIKQTLVNFYQHTVNLIDTKKVNYWLWNDYKKAVKLAGNIS